MARTKYPFGHIPGIPAPCLNCESHGAGVYDYIQERTTGGTIQNVTYILCNCKAAKYIENYYKFEAAIANDKPPKLVTFDNLFW